MDSEKQYNNLIISFADKIDDISSKYRTDNTGFTIEEHEAVLYFISNCSIADFEKLKEMDYDLSTAKTESDDTE